MKIYDEYINNISRAIQLKLELHNSQRDNFINITEEQPHKENAYIALLADTAERINTNQNYQY